MSRRESLVYSFATLSSDWVKAQFDCLEDACIVVIKTPSVVGDKYNV